MIHYDCREVEGDEGWVAKYRTYLHADGGRRAVGGVYRGWRAWRPSFVFSVPVGPDGTFSVEAPNGGVVRFREES